LKARRRTRRNPRGDRRRQRSQADGGGSEGDRAWTHLDGEHLRVDAGYRDDVLDAVKRQFRLRVGGGTASASDGFERRSGRRTRAVCCSHRFPPARRATTPRGRERAGTRAHRLHERVRAVRRHGCDDVRVSSCEARANGFEARAAAATRVHPHRALGRASNGYRAVNPQFAVTRKLFLLVTTPRATSP
jgi:hypothetical protein